MPRIYDNIESPLLPALEAMLQTAYRADFCVGYFNLRGWRHLGKHIQDWPGGENNQCRLLVGMQPAPEEDFRRAMSLLASDDGMDNQRANALKKEAARKFREQLTLGFQNNDDEAGLRRLAAQIRAGQLTVKLFLRHNLHAKLYLMHRTDAAAPLVGYVGSSNLTLSGLKHQGELNVDVVDSDAAQKLAAWFESRWSDRWCLDISEELVKIIEESWARTELIPPYHIYLNMAYHLSKEARAGLSQFAIPAVFGNDLFDYQEAAVKIAARRLDKRGGVLIGDVVGLGKTLMATALARVFEDDFRLETLILCPKNLVSMWDYHRANYGLRGDVLSTSVAAKKLPNLKPYGLVLIDESHNLRNRDGKRYRAIRDYIEKSHSKCILLTATPYNKTYLDLSNQLRLFLPDDADLGVRPENLLRQSNGEAMLANIPHKTLPAFEKSDSPDDWRELMRCFMVRRTRSFIQNNYAQIECPACAAVPKATDAACPNCRAPRPIDARRFLTFASGERSYFPKREPRTVKFEVDPQYAELYADDVVAIINGLSLPRYGLGNYVDEGRSAAASPAEQKTLQDLSRAGKRLMGFCRTNLFKRLESCGPAFLLSVERHILRNYLFLHALENNLPLPIGTQDAALLDTRFDDTDESLRDSGDDDADESEDAQDNDPIDPAAKLLATEADFRKRASQVYALYAQQYYTRFKWLAAERFRPSLKKNLAEDAQALQLVLGKCDNWEPDKDAKLAALLDLILTKRPNEKILIFTQYADTVAYLAGELQKRNVPAALGVTGQSADPTEAAGRFSPESNKKTQQIAPHRELRVLIATDVLSEGQNLQDAHIVVSYDLPWAIIRLIQRAGRVDRIGQKSATIECYSFLPADGVNNIIKLRGRLKQRLQENAEVVGTDEQFFEDEVNETALRDLFTEKYGLLEDEDDEDNDFDSQVLAIWNNAVAANPELETIIPNLPPVVFSARQHDATKREPEGVLMYVQTSGGNDALAWVDRNGNSVTENQSAILKAAECRPDTPAVERSPRHHEMVKQGVEHIAREERFIGGRLGSQRGARHMAYERLQRHARTVAGTLFDTPELHKAIEELYRFPLTDLASERIRAHIKNGISDTGLAEFVVSFWQDRRLCRVTEEAQAEEPLIVCSLGLTGSS